MGCFVNRTWLSKNSALPAVHSLFVGGGLTKTWLCMTWLSLDYISLPRPATVETEGGLPSELRQPLSMMTMSVTHVVLLGS